MYYDLIGQPLAGFIASNSYGLSTSLATPPNVYTSSQLPRFVGFSQIPSAPSAPLFFQPAPTPSFPVSYPNAFAIASSLDDRLKAPYTMNLNFSVAREFSHGWFVQAAYVGRLSRHNLVQRDLAMPTNLKDPKSGQSYYQAMTQLATLMDLQGVSIANLPKIPFFENFWCEGRQRQPGLTPTQVVAQDYLYNANQGDFTSVLSDIDNGQSCNANGRLLLRQQWTRQHRGLQRPRAVLDVEFAVLGAQRLVVARLRSLPRHAVDRLQAPQLRPHHDVELHPVEVHRHRLALRERRRLLGRLHDQLVERPATPRGLPL